MKQYSIKLNRCINFLPEIREITGDLSQVSYSDVCFDSRKIKAGDLFVALSGISVDGHEYIQSAIKQGAVAVIGMETVPVKLSVPYIRVADSRAAMGWAAAALYNFPSNDMTLIGVTGTDGKTTTSIYLYNILREAKLSAGLISTVSAVVGDEEIDTGFHVTTPDSPDIQRYLAHMRDNGITHVVCEATSHGLSQERLTGVDFDIAVVTNITHEHLDFHKSREAYFAAKGILFQKLGTKPRKCAPLAVLNLDDPDSYHFLDQLINVPKAVYSALNSDPNADCAIEKLIITSSGMTAEVCFRQKGFVDSEQKIRVQTKLLGNYNGENMLAAMTAAVYGLGIAPEIAARGIANVTGVPGRMQIIDMGQDFTAIVDFAHTPNALSRALKAARDMLPIDSDAVNKGHRVIAIYGSAGLRDREKRRMMPDVSVALADITILTAEDPRTEPLNSILKDMVDEAIAHGAVLNENLFVVPDRRDAIRQGLKLAQPGDIVLSLGKGHEQSMCFGTEEFLWDDRTAMKAALSEMLHKEGPAMPFLPDVPKYEP